MEGPWKAHHFLSSGPHPSASRMCTPAIYALESKPPFAAVRLRNETYQLHLTSASKAALRCCDAAMLRCCAPAMLRCCVHPGVCTLCRIPLRGESTAHVIVFLYFWETLHCAACGAERVSERLCPPGPASQQLWPLKQKKKKKKHVSAPSRLGRSCPVPEAPTSNFQMPTQSGVIAASSPAQKNKKMSDGW